MNISGTVQNGVVVLDGSVKLPEGAVVNVTYSAEPMIRIAPIQTRVQFPLVQSAKPGSVRVTNQMIAEILDEEDAASGH